MDFGVKVGNLPRVRNQLQLIESLKLVVFLSRCGKVNFAGFDGFEGFCTALLTSFVFGDADVMPLFAAPQTTLETEKKASKQARHANSNNCSTAKKASAEDTENLLEILAQMCDLAEVVLFSDAYSNRFRLKLSSLLSAYLRTLVASVSSKAEPRLSELKARVGRFSAERVAASSSLKDLCRVKINFCLARRATHLQQHSSSLRLRFSALSRDYIYFKLPVRYSSMVNYLTFGLVQDLYGVNFDLKFSSLSE